MLDTHLLYKVNGNACRKNIIFYKDYRITIITDSLFRIEQNKDKIFNDLATQTVINRDLGPVNFSLNEKENSLEIITSKIKIILGEELSSSRIVLDGKNLEISNIENLKGTFSTLDRYDGKYFMHGVRGEFVKNKEQITLCDGVCSKNGIAVLDDSKSLSFDTDGKICEKRALGVDKYVFAYGDNYKEAVRVFFKISGKPPIIPRFALGNWWSRYHDYSEEEYYKVLHNFEKRNIPITVAVIDMDWHYSNEEEIKKAFAITEEMANNKKIIGGVSTLGWTGYTWNKRLFPNYKRFIQNIKNKGYKVTLNVHPADGVRFWEDSYNDFAKAMDINPKTKECIQFDITNDDFVNNYFSLLHKPYEELGVDFWWLDWQQGNQTNIDGLTPLWALNHYHYLDNAKNHKIPLILSRFAEAGSQRYPIGFSGDTFITWETLDYLPEFVATSSNIGYGWWSNDIGGHMHGINDYELYTRMVQYGVFSPINRLHNTNDDTMTKEPWFYKNGTGLIAEEFLRLRHKLIPHLYSSSVKASRDGLNIVEPIYYYIKNEKAFIYKNEYFFCENMLIAPITSPRRNGVYSHVNTIIPKGKWTDFFTNEEYIIEKDVLEISLARRLDSIPVLVKEGTVVPLSNDKGNSYENPTELQIKVYEGNGEYELIEDGRNKDDVSTLSTRFVLKVEEKGNTVLSTLEISFVGETRIIPDNRSLEFEFVNVFDGEFSLFEEERKIGFEEIYNDFKTIKFEFDSKKKYRIFLEHSIANRLDILKRQFKNVLLELEGDNNTKFNIFNEIIQSEDTKEFIEKIEQSQLEKEIKDKIKEVYTF